MCGANGVKKGTADDVPPYFLPDFFTEWMVCALPRRVDESMTTKGGAQAAIRRAS